MICFVWPLHCGGGYELSSLMRPSMVRLCRSAQSAGGASPTTQNTCDVSFEGCFLTQWLRTGCKWLDIIQLCALSRLSLLSTDVWCSAACCNMHYSRYIFVKQYAGESVPGMDFVTNYLWGWGLLIGPAVHSPSWLKRLHYDGFLPSSPSTRLIYPVATVPCNRFLVLE